LEGEGGLAGWMEGSVRRSGYGRPTSRLGVDPGVLLAFLLQRFLVDITMSQFLSTAFILCLPAGSPMSKRLSVILTVSETKLHLCPGSFITGVQGSRLKECDAVQI
jgi:hypothetical protein